MITEKIDLYNYFGIPRGKSKGGYLTAYARTPLNEIKGKARPAMLVIPGGGYEWVSCREAEPVALAYMNEGYSSFVLEYSVFTPFPAPLLEGCMAVIYIRENAGKYGICAEQIGVTGFSAGGHLAGMLATMYAEKEITEILGERSRLARPDAAVLSYPVVSADKRITHATTLRVISGEGAFPYEKFSIDLRVTKDSVPAYIWHTYRDNVVPVENSLLLAQAYNRAGVPFALHIFENGLHGLSLANGEVSDSVPEEVNSEQVGKWFSLAVDWLKSRGFCVKVKDEKG